jgi:hypothetical protein
LERRSLTRWGQRVHELYHIPSVLAKASKLDARSMRKGSDSLVDWRSFAPSTAPRQRRRILTFPDPIAEDACLFSLPVQPLFEPFTPFPPQLHVLAERIPLHHHLEVWVSPLREALGAIAVDFAASSARDRVLGNACGDLPETPAQTHSRLVEASEGHRSKRQRSCRWPSADPARRSLLLRFGHLAQYPS